MATVTHVTDAEGYHHIGVKDGKAFIPFVSISPGQYAGLKQAGGPTAKSNDDDEKGGDE